MNSLKFININLQQDKYKYKNK